MITSTLLVATPMPLTTLLKEQAKEALLIPQKLSIKLKLVELALVKLKKLDNKSTNLPRNKDLLLKVRSNLKVKRDKPLMLLRRLKANIQSQRKIIIK